MKKIAQVLLVLVLMGLVGTKAVAVENASKAAEVATVAAEVATPASTLVERLVEKKSDITETVGEDQGKLERYLQDQELEKLSVLNALKYAIRDAVSHGVPANTIVLVLLFPLVATIIAASRHLVGLRGFGIFVPAVLSMAFVAMGVAAGTVLFLVVLGMAMLGRYLLRYLKLQYLPRMALLLWFVSLGVLVALFVSPWINLFDLARVNIFPILILILLAENFIEVQISKSQREATELTVETMILALICSLMLSLEIVQKWAILYPEVLVVTVGAVNVLIGRYSGLRLTEYFKYKKLLS